MPNSNPAMARKREKPTAEDVEQAMNTCEPYATADLVSEFEDTSRTTIRRRLESLLQDGSVEKKKHDDGRVRYWIRCDCGDEHDAARVRVMEETR